MRVLYLGLPCQSIETRLRSLAHEVAQTEDVIDIDYLERVRPDFGVSYRYARIIGQSVIDWFARRKIGLINLHISYLPWNRGSDPNLWSWLEDTPRGVSIHRVDAGLDTGDILLQREVAMDIDADTLRTSYEKLSLAIEGLFIEHADLLLSNAIAPRKQSAGGSFHLARDKNQFLPLIRELWWDTPVRDVRKAKIGEIAGKSGEITLLTANSYDRDFIFGLINDSLVRSMAFRQGAIAPEEHAAWFSRRLSNGMPFYIAVHRGTPCGYVRFEGKKGDAEISIVVASGYRGLGIGKELILSACRAALNDFAVSRIHARIKSGNAASIHVFKKAGFVNADGIGSPEIVCMCYPGYDEAENFPWPSRNCSLGTRIFS
jgi:methionyl-tRNA formyltransferase